MQEQAAGETFFHWLEQTALAVMVRQSMWLYPAVETAHIFGFVILVGAAAMFDLRLLGLSPQLPVREALRHLTRWARASLIVVIPTGFILFMTSATSLIENPAFLVKLVLIGMAGVNATIFHLITRKTVNRWNLNSAPPPGAKIAGLLSLMLWTGVITCGRLIAYV